MKFQAFHVNSGEKLKKKDVNNNLSHFMTVFPTAYNSIASVHNYQRVQTFFKKTFEKETKKLTSADH